MDSATVVIIGGGVIGLSCAYQLALRKPGRIVVLEKDKVGAGASGRAGGTYRLPRVLVRYLSPLSSSLIELGLLRTISMKPQ